MAAGRLVQARVLFGAGTTYAIRRYLRMRRVLSIAIILALGIGTADARRRHHHHYNGYNGPESVATGDAEAGGQNRPLAELVPPGWQEQPSEPNWNGRRFASPDGTAWVAMFTVPAGGESIAAHMKAVVFADGEDITYLRGQRSWIAVSGVKGDRAFYRQAVLACAGDRWHHIAFEYPAAAKADMGAFIDRAALAVSASANRACDMPASAAR